jgi:hypothetical protein
MRWLAGFLTPTSPATAATAQGGGSMTHPSPAEPVAPLAKQARDLAEQVAILSANAQLAGEQAISELVTAQGALSNWARRQETGQRVG